MPSLGSNDITVRIGSQADTSGIDKTSGSINRLESDSSGAGHGLAVMSTAATAAVAGIAVLGAGVAALSVASIKATGDFEANRVAFDVMLGSADKASKLMTQIAQFAKTTPFELPDVVSGAKKLLAYGFAQDEIIKTMTSLGDVAAGVGVNFGELVDIYGKARTQGTLFTQDFDQFTGRGIPLAQALSKELGVAPDKVRALASEGKITFPVLEKGFQEMTKSGSQFGGMMDKQSQTFNGVMSNLSDGFQAVLRHAAGMDDAGNIIKNGLFDRVKIAATAAMPVLQTFGDGIGTFTAKVLGKFDSLTSKITSAFGPAIDDIGKRIQDKFPSASSKVGELANSFEDKLSHGIQVAGKSFTDVMPDFLDKFDKVYRKVHDLLAPAIHDLYETFKTDLLPVLKRLAEEVLPVIIGAIGVTLLAAFKAVLDTLNLLLPPLTDFANWCLDNKEVVLGIAIAIGSIKLALAMGEAITAFQVAFGVAMATSATSAGGLAASIAGLQAFVAAPIAMPALVVVAALASIALVAAAVTSVIMAIQAMNDASAAVSKADAVAKQSKSVYENVVKNGSKYLPSQVADAKQQLALLKARGYATGTNNAPGGSVLVGENGPEIVNLPRGSQVKTNTQSQGMLNSSNNSGNIYVTNNINNQVDYDKGIMQLGFMLRTR